MYSYLYLYPQSVLAKIAIYRLERIEFQPANMEHIRHPQQDDIHVREKEVIVLYALLCFKFSI